MLDMIDDCYIVQDSYDSDHYPISFPVLGASQESWVSPPICLPKPNLGKVTPTDIESFQSCIESYLCSINLCNCDVICCSDAACYRSDHKAEIESLYHYSYNCLTNATKQCFSQRRPDSNFKKRVPGWNEYVCEAKAAASDVHYLQCQWNKPKFGPLFDLMRRTRAKYNMLYAIAVNRKKNSD